MSPKDVATCAEVSALLAERASGPLEAAEAATLDGHLAHCAQCRTAFEDYQALFSLLALPPPTLKEEAALRGLAERTLTAWRRRQARRRGARGLLVAAGLLAVAALPLWLWRAPGSPVTALATVATTQRLPLAGSSEATAWELEESAATDSDTATDDTPLLDGLALEGDGAFALGDSG